MHQHILSLCFKPHLKCTHIRHTPCTDIMRNAMKSFSKTMQTSGMQACLLMSECHCLNAKVHKISELGANYPQPFKTGQVIAIQTLRNTAANENGMK